MSFQSWVDAFHSAAPVDEFDDERVTEKINVTDAMARRVTTLSSELEAAMQRLGIATAGVDTALRSLQEIDTTSLGTTSTRHLRDAILALGRVQREVKQ